MAEPAESAAPRLSVVVPTFNRRASLLRLLTALAEQTLPAEQFEVVVVDDGSTDGTGALLRDLTTPYVLRVFEQPNGGPSLARNRGVTSARGELIVFLDDDVEPLPDALAEHVAAHQAGPGLVVVGPMSPPRNWPRPAWVEWEEEMLQVQYRAMLAGVYPCTPRQFYTGNASLARSQFLAVGGFDTSFRRAEDIELAYRLRDAGARFAFVPRAEVRHFAARSFASWCRAPSQYGRYDVAMERDKGHEAFTNAVREFHTRHPLNRLLARACVGRRPLVHGSVLALRVVTLMASGLGARQAARLALSGIFNLLYWQAASEELGGRARLWRAIAAAAPSR